MLLGLVVVVGIILLIFYFIKKGIGKKIIENELIKILGSKIISGNKALHLVEVGNSIYLIGSSNEHVNLIAEIQEKESKDTIKLKANEDKKFKSRTFQDIISNIFNPSKKKQAAIDESLNFMKKQRSRLRKLE